MTAIGLFIIFVSALAGTYCHSKWMKPDGSDAWRVAEDRCGNLMMVGFVLVGYGVLTFVWRVMP